MPFCYTGPVFFAIIDVAFFLYLFIPALLVDKHLNDAALMIANPLLVSLATV